jgi:hypothetical protein
VRRVTFLVALVLAGAASCGQSAPPRGSGASTASSTGTPASDGGGEAGLGGASGACATCAGGCVDLANDPNHCGACGHACALHETCDRGACAVPTCLVEEPSCPVDHVCCGGSCCPPWEMCCNVVVVDGGAAVPACAPIEAGACPTSCAACP